MAKTDKLKRIIALLLVLALVMGMAPARITAQTWDAGFTNNEDESGFTSSFSPYIITFTEGRFPFTYDAYEGQENLVFSLYTTVEPVPTWYAPSDSGYGVSVMPPPANIPPAVSPDDDEDEEYEDEEEEYENGCEYEDCYEDDETCQDDNGYYNNGDDDYENGDTECDDGDYENGFVDTDEEDHDEDDDYENGDGGGSYGGGTYSGGDDTYRDGGDGDNYEDPDNNPGATDPPDYYEEEEELENSVAFVWYLDGTRRMDKGTIAIKEDRYGVHVRMELAFDEVSLEDMGVWTLRAYSYSVLLAESSYALFLQVGEFELEAEIMPLAEVNTPFVDAAGVPQTPAMATPVTDQTTLGTGWFVVNGTHTIGSRISVNGNVNLILADGAILNANQGVQVQGANSLTIWAQTGSQLGGAPVSAGRLNAVVQGTGQGHSGIGGNDGGGSASTITINGGFVTATGANSENGGAGIGGGGNFGNNAGNGGTVNINGGTVLATGRGEFRAGAGIGGGGRTNPGAGAVGGAGGTVTITGGNVTAIGGTPTSTIAGSMSSGAGIGGGAGNATAQFLGTGGPGGTVTISGAQTRVEARGGRGTNAGHYGQHIGRGGGQNQPGNLGALSVSGGATVVLPLGRPDGFPTFNITGAATIEGAAAGSFEGIFGQDGRHAVNVTKLTAVPASLAYGNPVTLTATLHTTRTTGFTNPAPSANSGVNFQYQLSGSSDWTTIATATNLGTSTSTLGGFPVHTVTTNWTPPTGGTFSVRAIWHVAGTDNRYATGTYETSPNITVTMVNPTVTWPTNLTAYAGQTLSNVTLPDNTGGTAGVFSWVAAGTTSVGAVGTHQHELRFAPTANTSFNTVQQLVNVNVTLAAGSVITGALSDAPTITYDSISFASAAGVSLTPASAQPIHFAIATSYSAAPTTGWSTSLNFTGLNLRTNYWIWARGAYDGVNAEGPPYLVSGMITTASGFAGGDGTAGNPYQIATIAQLQNVNAVHVGTDRGSQHFRLTADIGSTANPVTFMIGGADAATDTFSGTFDGNGHTITIDLTGTAQTNGLFRQTQASGTIQNLTVAGSLTSTFGGVGTGGLVGTNFGTIINSTSTANVLTGTTAGGLVGIHSGTIRNSSATGNVSGTTKVGGLVGLMNAGGVVVDSLSSGTVTATAGSPVAGRLIGNIMVSVLAGSNIVNSYSTGTMNGGQLNRMLGSPGGDRWMVRLDSNGGTLTQMWHGVTATRVSTNAEHIVPAMSAPTRPGFVFDGWFTEATGGTQVVPGTTALNGDSTIFARWSAPVTVNSTGSGATGDGYFSYGTAVSIYAGTPLQHQEFSHWTATPAVTFLDYRNPSTSFIMPDQAVTVAANFTTVTGVTVNPPNVHVMHGTDFLFSAIVQGTNTPPQYVTWGVTGGTGTTNISTDGLLTVDAAQAAGSTLTVTATSVLNPNFSNTATVTVTDTPPVTEVTSVTVTPNAVTLYPGEVYYFVASAYGINPPQYVTWTVEGGIPETVMELSGGNWQLNISPNETAASLTVRATSTHTTTVSGTATVTVVQPNFVVTVISAGTGSTGSGYFAVGQTVSINAGTPPAAQQFSHWTAVPEVRFASANNASTSFAMISQPVSVTAHFTAVITAPPGGGNVGGWIEPDQPDTAFDTSPPEADTADVRNVITVRPLPRHPQPPAPTNSTVSLRVGMGNNAVLLNIPVSLDEATGVVTIVINEENAQAFADAVFVTNSPVVTIDLSDVGLVVAAVINLYTARAFADAGVQMTLVFTDAEITLDAYKLAALADFDVVGYTPITIELSVTPNGVQSPTGILATVDVGITVGDVAIGETDAPLAVAVSLANADTTGLNPWRIVAEYGNPTIVGGLYNEATGLFTFETQSTGVFTIRYFEMLTRLSMQIGSPTITDLAGTAPAQQMDVVPVLMDGRTLIPVRFVAEALNAEVDWTQETDQGPLVHVTLGGRTLTFGIGELTPELLALGMDVPARIIDGRTMVPLRFVSEFFGARVEWDEETRSIVIIMNSTGSGSQSARSTITTQVGFAILPREDEDEEDEEDLESWFV